VFEGAECGQTAFTPFGGVIVPAFCLGAPPQNDYEDMIVKGERRKHFRRQGNAGRGCSISVVFIPNLFHILLLCKHAIRFFFDPTGKYTMRENKMKGEIEEIEEEFVR
jgi:hypothetical protein